MKIFAFKCVGALAIFSLAMATKWFIEAGLNLIDARCGRTAAVGVCVGLLIAATGAMIAIIPCGDE